MITTPLIEALGLARKGYRVFPCGVNKAPTCPHGLNDASKDPAEVEELFRRYPGPLIGKSCDDFRVLDLDPKHLSAHAWWREHRACLPLTRLQRTRSGGVHVYFQPHPDFRCTVARLALGVDSRGPGGYVIAWEAAGLPTLHADMLAPVPQWLIDALEPKAPVIGVSRERRVVPDSRRMRGILGRLESASDGERNKLTYWAALCFSEMTGAQLPESEALHLIVSSACRAGLSVREATATAKSGLRGHR